MKNDELLISRLIEETCNEELKEDLGKTFNLSDYFERRVNEIEFLSLKKYLEQQELNSFQLSYLESIKCYRINMNNMRLDFPSNWSLFKNLKNTNLAWINKEEDNDFLCDIFSELTSGCEAFALINEANEFKLITFSDEEWKTHIEWINNYFENKKSKAA